jgi:beta-galactosidase
VAVDVIHAEADFNRYRIVIAPMLYMLRPGVAERIEQFVQAGGLFVTTYLSGIVDESDLCFINGYPQALRRTLGLYAEEMDTLGDDQIGKLVACEGNDLHLTGTYTFHHYAELVHVENAHIVAAYASEFYEGMPALTVNTHGAGQAYYIAPRTDEAFLDAFYGRLIERAGLTNGVFTAPTGVSIQMRESDTIRCWFVMNFTAEEQTVRVNEAVIDALSKTPIYDSLLLTPYDIAVVMQPKSSSQEVES